MICGWCKLRCTVKCKNYQILGIGHQKKVKCLNDFFKCWLYVIEAGTKLYKSSLGGVPTSGPNTETPAFAPLTCGLCFSHRAGMSLWTVLYSTGISYTCRSTLSPRPSFSSSWKGGRGSVRALGSTAITCSVGMNWPILRKQVGVLTLGRVDRQVCWSTPKLFPHYLPHPLASNSICTSMSSRGMMLQSLELGSWVWTLPKWPSACYLISLSLRCLMCKMGFKKSTYLTMCL